MFLGPAALTVAQQHILLMLTSPPALGLVSFTAGFFSHRLFYPLHLHLPVLIATFYLFETLLLEELFAPTAAPPAILVYQVSEPFLS